MVMGCDVIPSLIRAVGSWDLHLGACQNTFLRGSCGVLDDIGSQFNNERVVPVFNRNTLYHIFGLIFWGLGWD